MTQHFSSFHWLLTQRLAGVTASALRRLARFERDGNNPELWLQWSSTRLKAAGVSELGIQSIADWQRGGSHSPAGEAALRDQRWLEESGAVLLPVTHPDYPPLLLEITDPPPLLYALGDSTCLSAPQLAVVGSRRPTRQGVADAATFAGALAQAGFVVTSGLAQGIDAASHRAALDAGGKTVAVMGTGLDRIYPAANRDLADMIRRSGALITEFPLGTPPRAAHFPSRNRIISGLSLGALVVEAAVKSGSLVTARLALEQNREVFAIPGSIHNPVSRGCNSLIRNGATLVQDVRDILDQLMGWSGATLGENISATLSQTSTRPAPLPIELPADEAAVFAAIGFQPASLDTILESVTLAVPAVLAALAELELLGLLENRGGGYLRAEACAVSAG
ncbi:MAG: putative protecting protein DprA [Verrucomicrobiaceae bacterium]|nr:putative protecting protein DprA [Verrucomicrobiaceae bacterium]